MTKYHISKNGKPALCRATVKECPLGGDEVHFNSMEEAQSTADEKNKQNNPILASSIPKKSTKSMGKSKKHKDYDTIKEDIEYREDVDGAYKVGEFREDIGNAEITKNGELKGYLTRDGSRVQLQVKRDRIEIMIDPPPDSNENYRYVELLRTYPELKHKFRLESDFGNAQKFSDLKKGLNETRKGEKLLSKNF